MIKRCLVCTLPDNFPQVKLSEDNLCQYCLERTNNKEERAEPQKPADDRLTQLLTKLKSGSSADNLGYDCIVALSGGKDSCYTLMIAANVWKLRCLAITVDNGFLSDQAIQNSQRICDTVNADYLVIRPNTNQMKAMYRESLAKEQPKANMIKRASDLCSGCINIINKIMLAEALRRKVRLIIGGYIAGQVPKNANFMSLTIERIKYFSEAAQNRSADSILNSPALPQSSDFEQYSLKETIHIANPFLTMEYSEEDILRELGKIGWIKPSDTGAHSSNCRINDLGILNHQRKYDFHPYQLEIAEQVRSGTLSYEKAMAKLEAELDLARIDLVNMELGTEA